MRRAVALLLLICAANVRAAEVAVIRHENKLGVRLLAVAYPATLSKDLKSGLTNRLFARVTLMDSGNVLDQRTVEIALRYDLWDEKFSMVSTMNGSVVDSRNLANLAEVEALLGALPLPGLFDTSGLPQGQYLLRVELLLNPIDREKMRAIRKWVAQNTAPPVGDDQGVSASNSVFNRIFEQYADSDLAAAWRVTLNAGFHEGN
jgi:hypothetical protein